MGRPSLSSAFARLHPWRAGAGVAALLVVALGCGSNGPPSRSPDGATDDGSTTLPGDMGDSGDASPQAGDAAVSGGNPLDGSMIGHGDSGMSGEGGSLLVDGGAATSPLTVTRLRCDLRTNPLQMQSATPRLTWEIQTADTHVRGETQTFFEVLVASSAQKLALDQGDLWSSGAVSSKASKTVYAGPPLASLAHVFWKVRIKDAEGRVSAWSDAAEWTQGISTTADWGAQWITGAATATPMPIFRRQFDVPKDVQRAVISICGLGQYELRVNGNNVSDGVLDPGWTNFAKTCLYRTFDVTASLVKGTNAIGVLLGNGMYNVVGTAGRYTKFTGSFGAPKLIAHLDIHFVDGTASTVVTDTSWRTAPGPITFTSIYGGEDFDARNDNPGWDQAGYSDASWSPASVVASAPPALVAQSEPPIKIAQDFPSVSISEPQPGVFVYDLGQNFSGWPSIDVTGAAGAVVRLTPGELLTVQGTVTQASMGGPIWFAYTLRGGAKESWHPRFAYTGFRYLQVDTAVPAVSASRFPTRPQIVRLSGQFIHTSAEPIGDFTCSDPDVNRIHALILAALRSNLQSVVTDCPQREKLGWLEQAHLMGHAMMFNFDLQSLLEQTVANMSDAQTAAGLIPDIAPEFTVFSGAFRDSPEWGSSYVIVPWTLYQMHGDSGMLQQHYDGMKRYVNYLSSKATQGFLAYGLGDWYDVGPAAPGPSQLTSTGVTATAHLFQDATILQAAATILGHASDASQYGVLAAAAANAYTTKFWNAAGYFDRNSQTANAMPLALGMVPSGTSAQTLGALVQSFVATQYQVTAGDVGFAYVVPALSNAGRGDVLLRMLKQRTGPGYLYQLDHGATSLTEAWNAYPASSQNHIMLGHAERWFWEGLAGMVPDDTAPGFARFFVKPQMPTGIDSVRATYHSMQGVIASSWVRRPTGVDFTIAVPVNTSATIYIPTQNPAGVTESGMPLASAPGVTAVRPSTGGIAVDVGSGQYVFAAN